MSTQKFGTKFFFNPETQTWSVNRWFRVDGKIVNKTLTVDSKGLYVDGNLIIKGSDTKELTRLGHEYIMANSNMNQPLGWLPNDGDYESPAWVQPWNGQLRKLVRTKATKGYSVTLYKAEMIEGQLIRRPVKSTHFADCDSTIDHIRREYMKGCEIRRPDHELF